MTQLLGQLEHSGPPPLPRERLANLPTEQVTEEQANANTACSVCWENFQLGLYFFIILGQLHFFYILDPISNLLLSFSFTPEPSFKTAPGIFKTFHAVWRNLMLSSIS